MIPKFQKDYQIANLLYDGLATVVLLNSVKAAPTQWSNPDAVFAGTPSHNEANPGCYISRRKHGRPPSLAAHCA
jgi:hypothetical protein